MRCAEAPQGRQAYGAGRATSRAACSPRV